LQAQHVRRCDLPDSGALLTSPPVDVACGSVAVLLWPGETLLRKLGRVDMIKKQSVPEIVFAYFHNK
jgi:hypothetical protein